MSYIFTLRRPDGRALTVQEVLAVVEEADDLEADRSVASDDELLFRWTGDPSGNPAGWLLTEGETNSTTTPSNAALRRIQRLAHRLDASVYGEEGEDLTDVEVPDFEVSSAGVWGCVGLVLLVVALVVWWLL